MPMDVYIQSNQKHFFLFLALSSLSTTASNGSWMSLWICSNAKADSLSCHIVARKCVFTRINLLKHLSAVAVEDSIVSRIFNIYIFGYKVLFTGSKDGMVLPDLWDIIHMFYLICVI
jgi:hypothetical protein